MENKYSGRSITFETLEKAVSGDYNAMQEVIRLFKPYMTKLSMEIEDKRTVYGECTYHMVPREDEPSVCLMHDWIYLPSA